MNEINKGFFEEIKELDEEQNYSSGFNSQRSGDKGINESKYSQMKGSVIDEEDVEEVFSDEDNEPVNTENDKETSDFVNLETPLAVGKSKGVLEKESQSGNENDTSEDEVNMFDFKTLQQSEEEGQKNLIVSEAFVEEEQNKIINKNDKEIIDKKIDDKQTLIKEEKTYDHRFVMPKPGDIATPNTPLIEKCKKLLLNILYKFQIQLKTIETKKKQNRLFEIKQKKK